MDDGDIWGFQLCYKWNREERALTWMSDSGYSHDRIDDVEGNPTKNQPPILVADGTFPAREVLRIFLTAAATIEPEIRDFVLERICAFDRVGLPWLTKCDTPDRNLTECLRGGRRLEPAGPAELALVHKLIPVLATGCFDPRS